MSDRRVLCSPKDHRFAPNGTCWGCNWSRFWLQCYAVATLAEFGEPARCECGELVRWEGADACEKCYHQSELDRIYGKGNHQGHPEECAICQKNGVTMVCENIGRISDEQARRQNRPWCRGSGGRCGGRATAADGLCMRHANFTFHHKGDKPGCPDCKDYENEGVRSLILSI